MFDVASFHCYAFYSLPGWIDNFNGPTGLLIACGIGLLRTSYGDPDVVSDFTPVDTSIKAMIVAAWKRGIQAEVLPDTPVYNCSTSIQRKFTTGFIIEMGRKLACDVPLDKMMWLPGGSITKCRYNNYFRVKSWHRPQVGPEWNLERRRMNWILMDFGRFFGG